MAVSDVFLTKILENIANNGLVIISTFDRASSESCKIQDKAGYVTEGEFVDALAKAVAGFSKDTLKLKGG